MMKGNGKMWQVETTVRLYDKGVVGYSVDNQIGGDDTLPIEIVFSEKKEANELRKWLQKKEDWIDKLELIIEMETDINLDELREKFETGWR